MISLRKFAKIAKVSPATVSRAFSGSASVQPETREHILDLAKTYGFSPTCARPASVNGSTRSVGLLVPTLGLSYFSDIALGVQSSLNERGFLAISVEARAVADGDRGALKRLLEHSVDGLILDITNESVSKDEFQRLSNFEGPIVQVESRRAGFSTDVVATDDMEGGRLAAQHLLELGHRRIAFCRYGEGHSTCEARFIGFKSALDASGTGFDGNLEIAYPWTKEREETLASEIKRLLSLPLKNRPTAIFAPMDTLACQVYEIAAELGVKIPDDLSVIGYSDLDFAKRVEPKLTTVRQDGVAVGREAAKLFFGRMDDPSAALKVKLMPVELVVRGSTAPASSKGSKR